jgi:hypothetical protein
LSKSSDKQLLDYDPKGINVLCPCDGNEYSLFTGQGGSEYPLKVPRRSEWECIAHLYLKKSPKAKLSGFS